MWHRKFSFLTKYKDVWSSNRSILRRSSYFYTTACLWCGSTNSATRRKFSLEIPLDEQKIFPSVRHRKTRYSRVGKVSVWGVRSHRLARRSWIVFGALPTGLPSASHFTVCSPSHLQSSTHKDAWALSTRSEYSRECRSPWTSSSTPRYTWFCFWRRSTRRRSTSGAGSPCSRTALLQGNIATRTLNSVDARPTDNMALVN